MNVSWLVQENKSKQIEYTTKRSDCFSLGVIFYICVFEDSGHGDEEIRFIYLGPVGHHTSPFHTIFIYFSRLSSKRAKNKGTPLQCSPKVTSEVT